MFGAGVVSVCVCVCGCVFVLVLRGARRVLCVCMVRVCYGQRACDAQELAYDTQGTHEVIMWSARGFDHKSLVFGRRQLNNLLQSLRATCVRARKC